MPRKATRGKGKSKKQQKKKKKPAPKRRRPTQKKPKRPATKKRIAKKKPSQSKPVAPPPFEWKPHVYPSNFQPSIVRPEAFPSKFQPEAKFQPSKPVVMPVAPPPPEIKSVPIVVQAPVPAPLPAPPLLPQKIQSTPVAPQPVKITITKHLKPQPLPWLAYLDLFTVPSQIVKPTSIEWLQGDPVVPNQIPSGKMKYFMQDKRPLPSTMVPDDMLSFFEDPYTVDLGTQSLLVHNGRRLNKWLHKKVMEQTPMHFTTAYHTAEVFGHTRDVRNRTADQIVEDLREYPMDAFVYEHIHLVANMMVDWTLKVDPKVTNLLEGLEVKATDSVVDVVLRVYQKWFRPITILSSTGPRHTYSSSGLRKIIKGFQLHNLPSWRQELGRLDRLIG